MVTTKGTKRSNFSFADFSEVYKNLRNFAPFKLGRFNIALLSRIFRSYTKFCVIPTYPTDKVFETFLECSQFILPTGSMSLFSTGDKRMKIHVIAYGKLYKFIGFNLQSLGKDLTNAYTLLVCKSPYRRTFHFFLYNRVLIFTNKEIDEKLKDKSMVKHSYPSFVFSTSM